MHDNYIYGVLRRDTAVGFCKTLVLIYASPLQIHILYLICIRRPFGDNIRLGRCSLVRRLLRGAGDVCRDLGV
jgi:hypothetical protein